MSGRWMAGAAALVVIAILSASAMMRSKAPTVSVGDEALLEIYTLHAARGALRVGAYSRFLWNHPGPSLFYLFAPGYVLSGYREDSLFATTLICNVAAFAVLLWLLRKYGGNSLSLAAACWFVVLVCHTGHGAGWDFGDWLGSSWNPHAPMVPLALLIALSASVGAGAAVALPAMVAVASFVVQAHIGLAPVSFAVVGVAVGLFVLAFVTRRAPPRVRVRVPVWARILDGLALAYGALLVRVLVLGGFDAHVGRALITVNSGTRLLSYIAVLVVVRHIGCRAHPLLSRLVAHVLRWRWLSDRGPRPANTRSSVIAAFFVALAFWSLPLLQEFTASGPGNLTKLARFAGEGDARDVGAGIAAFTYYLSGAIWRGLDVAAGGKTLSGADIGWAAVVASITQLLLVCLILRQAIARNRTFQIALCTMCLVASAAALASVLHVRGGLYDHLAFWIVIPGLMNLTVITGAAAEWIWMRLPPLQRVFRPSLAVAVLVAAVSVVAARGTQHLLAGHQQARFATDVADVRALSAALDGALHDRGMAGQAILIDASQDAWSVTAGLVLEVYKRGPQVAVARQWAPIFGEPLTPTGREAVEVTLADHERSRILSTDPAYQLIGQTTKVDMYVRALSRATRVKLRSTPL